MSVLSACTLVGVFAAAVRGQQVGTTQAEVHPPFNVQECAAGGACSELPGSIVMDMQWRWLHNQGGYTNCLVGGEWNPQYCPDAETCSKTCALEGLDLDAYSQTYGVDPITGGVKLHYIAPEGAIASRVYLLENDNSYRMFKLKNREITVTVDVSTLPCGLNGAIYFVEMPQNGGLDGNLNTAGAKYGTGYCDAQCPRGMKFVKNLADVEDYKKITVKTPELKEIQVGPVGKYGACCAEMDLYEANREASAYTAHPCKFEGVERCVGEEECGNKDKGYMSDCDKDGCAWNDYRNGNKHFFGNGPENAVDTSKPVTLVTQFITDDGTDAGDLKEIRRVWIQDGKVIDSAKATNIPHGGDSITDEYCDVAAKTFNETSYTFPKNGGLKSMGEALERGMVLTMSVWDDSLSRMLWLDAAKDVITEDTKDPGVIRGPCSFESGNAKLLHKEDKNAFVTFTDVKFGPIGSTFHGAAAAPAAKFEVMEDKVGRVPAAKSALSASGADLQRSLIAAGRLGSGIGLMALASFVVVRAGYGKFGLRGNDARLLVETSPRDEEEPAIE